uniref:Putative secreted protein n=1 Tax=Panstrongylus lignarius TaxID=156445 RepID=A0A224Y4I7_9HEMI
MEVSSMVPSPTVKLSVLLVIICVRSTWSNCLYSDFDVVSMTISPSSFVQVFLRIILGRSVGSPVNSICTVV